MSKRKGQVCSPFIRGFLPGVIFGVFTSVLLFSLWRYPLTEEATTAATAAAARNSRGGYDGAATQGAQKNPKRPPLPDSRGSKNISIAPATSVGGEYELLVFIHSPAGSRVQREAVRKTWLSYPKLEQRVLARFLVGERGLEDNALKELTTENRQHGDILLLPTGESEADSADSRTILQAFSWGLGHVNFQYLLKCRDTTFVVVHRLISRLRGQKNYLWGFFAGLLKAERSPNSSRLVEEEWRLCSHYLPYPEGGGYVLSRDLVELVVEMGPDLHHYRHDDIALGVWLSPFKDVWRNHDARFNSGRYSRGCHNNYIVTVRESAEGMMRRQQLLQTVGKLCATEQQTRLSYRYNWTAPAGRCCVRTAGIP